MTNPKIKPVNVALRRHNRYCGPAALSIITGVDTADAAALLRDVSGKTAIKGTSSLALLTALKLLGFSAVSALKVDPLRPKSNPTLAAWLKSPARDGQALYLVAAGNHWQVVQGRRYCCGLTKSIVSIRDDKVRRRARITGVWRIEQEAKVDPARVVPVKAKPADPEATTRRKARQIAKQYGIKIEIERNWGYNNIVVWGPSWVASVDEDEVDPFYGNHYADDWADALGRVQDYAALIEKHPEYVA